LFSYFPFWYLFPNIFYFSYFFVFLFLKKGKIKADSMRKINNFENDALKAKSVEKKFEI
jgi:hypothetical protein